MARQDADGTCAPLWDERAMFAVMLLLIRSRVSLKKGLSTLTCPPLSVTVTVTVTVVTATNMNGALDIGASFCLNVHSLTGSCELVCADRRSNMTDRWSAVSAVVVAGDVMDE
jgi:hypothetical protein